MPAKPIDPSTSALLSLESTGLSPDRVAGAVNEVGCDVIREMAMLAKDPSTPVEVRAQLLCKLASFMYPTIVVHAPQDDDGSDEDEWRERTKVPPYYPSTGH